MDNEPKEVEEARRICQLRSKFNDFEKETVQEILAFIKEKAILLEAKDAELGLSAAYGDDPFGVENTMDDLMVEIREQFEFKKKSKE
jgi:hypothetical protein